MGYIFQIQAAADIKYSEYVYKIIRRRCEERKDVASRGYHDLVPTFGACSRQSRANRHLNSIVSVLSFCFNPPFAISQPRIDLQAAHRDCCSNQDAFCAIRACQVTSAVCTPQRQFGARMATPPWELEIISADMEEIWSLNLKETFHLAVVKGIDEPTS